MVFHVTPHNNEGYIILLKKAGTLTGTHKLPEEEFPTFEIEVVCALASIYTYTRMSQNLLLQPPHFNCSPSPSRLLQPQGTGQQKSD